MEHGDLSEYAMPRLTVVLEGVLANVEITTTGKRWKKQTQTHLDWMELPLKGMVSMRRLFPETAIDVLTFISEEVCEAAAQFFLRHGIAVNRVYFENYDTFCTMLKFRIDVVAIYDSDQERLNGFGQVGKSVVRGWAF
jgi:hypothetical protein